METVPFNLEKDHLYEIRCPVCFANYQHHLSCADIRDGEDSGAAEPQVRGNVISIPFHGECGHIWELCIGFHKGDSFIFSKTDGVVVHVHHMFCREGVPENAVRENNI